MKRFFNKSLFAGAAAVLASAATLSAQSPKPNSLTAHEIEQGWQLLFDGTTLAGWHIYGGNGVPAQWSARNGELIFSPVKGQMTGDIVTDGEFDNFDLRMEWKIIKGGNSGIFFGVNESLEYPSTPVTGVEMQVLDNIDGADRNDPTHLAGAMYDLVDAGQTSKPKPVGQWNEVRILKNNGQVTFWLNGVMTANVFMGGYEWDEMVKDSKFNTADKAGGADFGKFMKGRIALQDHLDPVSFRNIKIKKLDKKVALQLYSLRDEIGKDFDGVINAVADMGYKQIEAAGYGDGKFYGKSPAEFKSVLDGLGLEPLSSHTGNVPGADQLDNPAVLKWWDDCIAAHKAVGMKYIVIPGFGKLENLADMKKTCDFLNRIGEKCNAAGLKLGYHNHDFEYGKIEDAVMYDYMIENTDPDKVFFQMDIYWTVMGKHGPVEYFRRYPGRFKLLHIKDRKELGESGLVDFDAVFRNTDLAGVEGIIIEVEQYDYAPRESVKRSLDYLLSSPYVKPDYSK